MLNSDSSIWLAYFRVAQTSCDDDLLQMFPTRVTACAASAAFFSWRFIIPLVIFVLCYWKIISSLRRRAKVATSQRQQQQQPATGPLTTAASSRHSKPPSKTQKNVIKMMIIIISCFIVCWLPVQITLLVRLCSLGGFYSDTLYSAFVVFAFASIVADPFIYATGTGSFQFLRAKCSPASSTRG